MSNNLSSEQTLSLNQRRIILAAESIRNEPDAVDLAYLARPLIQATLPHSDPGPVPVWGRTNGRIKLSIKPDWEIDSKTNEPRCIGVPYGTIPRLLLFWINTEAARTKNRRLELGSSLSAFMRELDLIPSGGRWGTIPRLREQMSRLFRAKISFEINSSMTQQGQAWLDMQVAPRGELWWHYGAHTQGSLWQSWIELSEEFFEAICSNIVPLDMRALRALKRSPLALDLYAWANYRSFTVTKKDKDQFIPWYALKQQMGSDYKEIDNFRKKVKGALSKVASVSPDLKFIFSEGGIIIYPSQSGIKVKKQKLIATSDLFLGEK